MISALELEISALEPIALKPLPRVPLVSVLMANFNYAQFLPESIESVLSQTYSNWELIICDDGSTDGSIAVIEAYQQSRKEIRLIRKENGGHASAINAAFQECMGQIVCFLDSDDLFIPGKLKAVVEAFEESPECGFLVHRVTRVTQDRRPEGVWPLTDSLPSGWYGPKVLVEGGIVTYMPPTSGLSLRQEVANCLFPLPTHGSLRMCPDQVLMRLAPLVTPIAKLQAALAEFRLHTANTYGARRTTIQSLAREMGICQELWKAQFMLLQSISPQAATELQPLETSAYFLYLQYLRSKLSRDRDVRAHYEDFMSAIDKNHPNALDQVWRYSLYLPTFVFDSMINLLLGQSALKQMLARLKKVA